MEAPQFKTLAENKQFTFRVPPGSPSELDHLVASNPLKRGKATRDAPTPATSPIAKRTRPTPVIAITAPPLLFSVEGPADEDSGAADSDLLDVFGSLEVANTIVDADVHDADDHLDAPEKESTKAAPAQTTSPDSKHDVKRMSSDTADTEEKAVRHPKLTGYWTAETEEQKELRRIRDFEKRENDREKHEQKERQGKRTKLLETRAAGKLRAQKHRDKVFAEKTQAGWTPYANRKRVRNNSFSRETALTLYQKHAELSVDETVETAPQVAEVSRPFRQFKTDEQKKKKLCGRKSEHEATSAVRINWQQPLIWSQIETAAKRATKPWMPSVIAREAKKINSKTFATLTPQVVGRWICKKAKSEGKSRWREEVLEAVKNGNSPGGATVRRGILVRKCVYARLMSRLTVLCFYLIGIISDCLFEDRQAAEGSEASRRTSHSPYGARYHDRNHQG